MYRRPQRKAHLHSLLLGGLFCSRVSCGRRGGEGVREGVGMKKGKRACVCESMCVCVCDKGKEKRVALFISHFLSLPFSLPLSLSIFLFNTKGELYMWGDVKTSDRTTRLPTRVTLPDGAATRSVCFGSSHRLILGERRREGKGEGSFIVFFFLSLSFHTPSSSISLSLLPLSLFLRLSFSLFYFLTYLHPTTC